MPELDLNKIDLGSFGVNEEPLNANLTEALKTNPEQHAKALKLSQESGVPAFAVQSNPAEVEHKLKLDKIDVKGLTQRAPATAGFLSNYDNAVIAQEDVVANLLEGIERTFKGLGESIGVGFDIQTRGAVLAANEATSGRIDDLVPFYALPIGMEFEATQISREMASNFGITTDQQLQQAKQGATDRLLKEIQDFQAQRKALTPEDLNILQEGVRAGIESIAMNAPGVALAVLSGGRAAPVLVSMGAQTFAGSYGEGRAEGLTPEQARWYAGIDAAIEVGTEVLPTGTLERMLTGQSKGLTKEALKFMVQEMGTEQLATLGQSINAYAFGLDKEMEAAQSAEEMVQIQLRRQAVTAVATLVAGGAQATAVSAANKAIERLSQTEQQADNQSAVEQRAIDKLAADAAKSKLRERDVETFKQFIRDTDGEATSVYIDGPQTSLFLQSKTREEIDADPALKALWRGLSEARIAGTDVAVTIDDFMGDIAGTEAFTALREHMTLSTETVSPFRQEQHREETRKYVDRLMATAQDNVSEYVEAQDIYSQVKQQLVDSGMVSPANAGVMAQIVPAWATSQAKRTGRTVKEVYESAGLTIEGPKTGEMSRLSAEALSQAQAEGYEGSSTGEAREWVSARAKGLDMSVEARTQRAKDMGFDTETTLYHGTAADFAEFKRGTSTTARAGKGIYFTPNAPRASMAANIVSRTSGGSASVIPVYIRANKQFVTEWDSDVAVVHGFDTDALEKQGYTGITLLNRDGSVREITVFDPKNIRSVNAAFDPDYSESSNLLAQSATEDLTRQLPMDRTDVYRAYARMEGSPEELSALTKQFADQNERLFSIENKPDFITDEMLAQVPDPAFIVGKVLPLAHVFTESGDAYKHDADGNMVKLSDAEVANVAAKMLTPIYNEIRESSPEAAARRAQQEKKQKELDRRQKRVENAPKATGDFDADLKAYADYAEDFREFQDLLSADMLDISDRNRTRLARAAIALDPDADTAANVVDTQPFMVEDAQKYGTAAERAAANAITSKSKQITVYRAMPADAKMEAGDWVGLVKSYAKGHESNVQEGKAATRQKTVNKEELYWYGADFNEWVYVPKGTWGDYTSLQEVWQALAPGKPMQKQVFEQSATEDPRNLFVAHNISEAGLAAADELGGLAAPSIAVASLSAGGFDQFGEITLLADPDVLNDPTFRTFDADIYSARQPRPVDDLSTKKVRGLMEAVSVANEGTGLRELHQITEISDMDKDSVFHYWLTTVGKAPKQVKMKPTEVSKAVEGVSDYDLLESPAFKAAVSKKYQKEITALIEAYPDGTDRKFIMDVASEWFDIKIPEDLELRWLPEESGYAYFRGVEKVSDTYSAGNRAMSRRVAETRYRKEIKEAGDFEIDYDSPRPNVLSNEVAEVRKVRSGIDTDKFSADLAKKNQNKKLRAEFKQWMTDTYADMLVSRKLFKGYTPAGDRKYAEYTLNNVVKEMTKTLQGGESFNYGVASVRARYANELSTKEKVQASHDKIISSDEMAKVKEEAAAKFEKALEDLKPFYKFDTESWGYGNDVAEAITQGPTAVREAFGNNPEANKIIRELGAYLAALPTEYFEAKVQRAMDFSEFNTAVVPKGASKKTLDLLKSKGLKIVRYDPSVEGSRTEVVANQTKLLFQSQQKPGVARGYYDPENSIIRLTEASDLSTFLHEFAHFMYEMELKSGSDMVQSINGWFKRNAADVAKEANGYLGREQAALQQSSLESESQRKERARKQGFDVDTVWYHGTTKDFEGFSDEMLSSNTGAISSASGHFFTSDPAVANKFAKDGIVIPVYLKKGKYPNLSLLAVEGEFKGAAGKKMDVRTESGDILKRWKVDPHEVLFDEIIPSAMGKAKEDLTPADIKKFIDEKKAINIDGYLLEDTWYDAVTSAYNGYPKPHSVKIVFDPRNIRSVFAQFEDEKSSRLLAQGTPSPQAGRITEEDVVAFLDNTTTGDAAKDAAIRRAVHEQFARGFETYLMEGKAPSIELRNAFRTFARWLAQIYRAIKGDLKVSLDDDMRQVFDRLLATEDQIAAAESRARVEPMFTDAAMAGMTEQEFIDYKARQEKVKDVQSETLRDKLIAAFTRKTQQWWKEERADLVDEYKAELAKERVYAAAARLKHTSAPDADIEASIRDAKVRIESLQKDIVATEKQIKSLKKNNDTILQFISKKGGLSREEMEAEGIDPAHFKDKAIVFGKPLFPKQGGMSTDAVAELLNEKGHSVDANDALEIILESLQEDTRYVNPDVNGEIDYLSSQISSMEESIMQAEDDIRTAANAARMANLKLDHATVKEMVGEARTNKLGRTSIAIPSRLVGMTAKGQQGVHPDIAAAFLGYESGAQMLHDLTTSMTLKEAAEAKADAEMLARHGDPFTDGTIEQLADEAVQNEERGKLILQELKYLSRGTSQRTLDRQTLKAVAEERIGQLSFREIHPGKYRKAEIRAAQEAARMLAEGNKEGAAQAKARQALNYYLGMAATDAKNNVTSITERMARYDKKKVREEIMKAEGGYWEQIEKILSRFEFRKSATLAQVDKVNQDINTWAKERMEVDGDGLVLHPAVLNESYVTHWKNVAYSDLVGISDSVKNIEHVARYANKLTRMGEEIEFNKLVDRWVNSIDANSKRRFKPKRTDVVEGRNWGRWAMAQMTKIPFMASWLDGQERAGISHQVLVQPFTDAYAQEQALWASVGKSVMALIEGRDKATVKRHNTKLYIPEIDDNLYGHQVLAVALNTGNQGNLKKMLLGEGWANPVIEAEISLQNVKLQAVLRHMTKADWEMVQTIWDRMEELYPMLAEVHRKTTGLTPPKVEATPVETPFGTFKGGYYPVKYDPNRGEKAAANEDRLNAETESMFSNGSSIQASVNAGATNARTGYYAPIRLSLDVVPSHFQEAIHYITHHDAVREVNRLIRDSRVSKAIKESLGPEEYAQLKPWLNDIAKDGREAPTKMFWDDLLQRLRFGVTLGAMGFKASTGIIQISGLSNTLAEVGVAPVMQAMRTVLGSVTTMRSAWDFASENSKVLKHRANSMDREIKNAMKRIEGKRGVLAAVQEASMKHIALIQTYMVDLPSWHAAYIKGMSEWGDETRAYQYADWVIENVQGSGATKDLAAIMRGQAETGRMFTMFMTFFSSLWNMERDIVKGAKSGAYSTTSLAAKLMFLFTLPVLFEMLMRGEFWREDEDDEDALLQTALTKVAMYPVQSVPFVRDIANAVTGDFGYNITPLQSIIEQGTQTVPKLIAAGFTDDEITKSQAKGATKFVGAALGIPGTGQAWATGEHLYQVLAEGEELTVHQLLFGPERK